MAQHPIQTKQVKRVSVTSKRHDTDDFSGHILDDLIDEGYTGEELKREFKFRKSQLRPAVEALITDAIKYAEPITINEFFEEDHADED